MKKFNKKSLAMLICAALLLTFTVSGTVAYLVADTDELVNTFTPPTVNTEIEEEFKNNVKSEIAVKNKGSIPMYVRVAVIGNWVKDGQVVESWTPDSDQYNSTQWFKDDGFHYYKYVVAPSGSTTDLLNKDITTSTREDGAHLEVTVIHQSIQAEPKDAVTAAWGPSIASNLSDKTYEEANAQ